MITTDHVLVTTVGNSSPSRWNDFLFCLQSNRAFFRSIYVLTELCDLDFQLDDVIVISTLSRPTFRNMIEFAGSLKGDPMVVFANCDILFDVSIKLLTNLRKFTFLAITKREQTGYFASGNHPEITQDAWVFDPKSVPLTLLQQTDIYPGTMGCENRLAECFYSYGYKVANPCITVSIHHIHSWFQPSPEESRVYGTYCFVPACTLEQIDNPPRPTLAIHYKSKFELISAN